MGFETKIEVKYRAPLISEELLLCDECDGEEALYLITISNAQEKERYAYCFSCISEMLRPSKAATKKKRTEEMKVYNVPIHELRGD